MSSFTGVTFSEQAVTPSDDAIVRRAILPDGILSGCELSYSGSTLTMAAGHLMICGRQIRHPSAQNWAVVDATSGYARLLLTIDLTRTATEETFDQVVDSIEYASAKDGFVDLEQTDINLSGTRYQVAVCVVSLGTGGITGIVSNLEKSEPGAGLNFNVVGGLTQPTDPKENTIWVKTNIVITGWEFSPTEPTSRLEGLVWIVTGKTGQVVLNALKKNGIILYTITGKQYVSGSWVTKDVKIYQGNAWKSLELYFYLFKEGNGLADGYTGFTNATCTDDLITMTITSSNSNTVYSSSNQTVDVTEYTKVTFEGVTASWSGTGSYSHSMYLYVGNTSVKIGTGNASSYPNKVMCTDKTFTIDISALTGKQSVKGSYLCSDDDNSVATIKISNIYFS